MVRGNYCTEHRAHSYERGSYLAAGDSAPGSGDLVLRDFHAIQHLW